MEAGSGSKRPGVEKRDKDNKSLETQGADEPDAEIELVVSSSMTEEEWVLDKSQSEEESKDILGKLESWEILGEFILAFSK